MFEMNFPQTTFPEAPVRAEDLRYIVGCVRKGQCCSLVGPSNMGKSLLLKSLLKEDVCQQCAQKRARPPVVVFVDYLEAGDSEQAFYELFLRCILEALEASNTPEPTVTMLRTLYSAVMDNITDVAVRSLFARSVRELMWQTETALIVVLDEFDDVFRTLAPWPFRQLRVLRDTYGSRLCYVVATSRCLERLRSDPDTYEFRELFQTCTRMLRPLHTTDVERFVTYLAEKRGYSPKRERVALVSDLSGGHPGLIECVYDFLRRVRPDPTTPLQAVVAELSEQWPIQQECGRLWDEIEEDEREGLLVLVGGGKLGPRTARGRQGLEAKGLVVKREGGSLIIFSPVFEAFVRQELGRQRQTAFRGPWYDEETRQIWLDEKDITRELSADQYALLAFMCQRPGRVCTKDEIAEKVWTDQSKEGITDGQIYQLVKRVREKIEPDPLNPRYIVTIRGQGYRLEVSSN